MFLRIRPAGVVRSKTGSAGFAGRDRPEPGHSSIATNADIYGHDDEEAAAEAAELVARTLEGR